MIVSDGASGGRPNNSSGYSNSGSRFSRDKFDKPSGHSRPAWGRDSKRSYSSKSSGNAGDDHEGSRGKADEEHSS